MVITQAIKKWGNGTGVRIPKQVMEAANIKVNQPLEISLREGSIVLTPVKDPREITLDSLLEGVTPELVGGEYDWGPDVGREIIDC